MSDATGRARRAERPEIDGRVGVVAVVGSVNVDCVVAVEKRPLPGETVLARAFEVHPGGKGANQAVAAARAGAVVELIGRVGDDDNGGNRSAELAAEGVGNKYLTIAPSEVTGMAFVTLTPDGENSIVVVPGANATLTPRDVQDARGVLASCAVLLAQLEVPMAAVAQAVALAGTQTTVVLNCAPYVPLPAQLLSRVDVLIANTQEAEALTSGYLGREAARFDTEILRRLGPRAIVVTRGSEGALLIDARGSVHHVPAPQVTAVDTTGAGDAFAGAFAAALSFGASLPASVEAGVSAGAITTTHRGAVGTGKHLPR